jgi:phospholipid/cholesterol/gamma-HCH transport system substrate-binding protein
VKRAIKNHTPDFVAFLVLIVLAVIVVGYILHEEGFRFPFIQSSTFTVNAEFSTAQAVTPGQGQTVRVSGVQIGTLSGVSLKNGYAIVQMSIDPKYKRLIHSNATALLRPKTGLQDMFVELNPGSSPAPVVKAGYTIPLAQTDPEINFDEVLASLDADTRQYLDLLVNGAGQGLQGQGNNLAGVFERFEPTHQDLARLNGAVAVRGRDLRQLVNSLRRLNDALAAKQGQIVDMIDSSSKVFGALASEDSNISRAVGDLPGTLQQTTLTLEKVQAFASQLGPAASKLLPAAQDLPAANAAIKALALPNSSTGYLGGTSIVQNQIRPFVVASRPVVRDLKPASNNLATATPNLSKTFKVINDFFNVLGYYPAAPQHGYLWWLSWLAHDGRTLFSIQDAAGDFRPVFVQASCATIGGLVNLIPGLSAVLPTLTNILSNAQLCPAQAGAIQSAYRNYRSGAHVSGSSLTDRLTNLLEGQLAKH